MGSAGGGVNPSDAIVGAGDWDIYDGSLFNDNRLPRVFGSSSVSDVSIMASLTKGVVVNSRWILLVLILQWLSGVK